MRKVTMAPTSPECYCLMCNDAMIVDTYKTVNGYEHLYFCDNEACEA
jgi:hypothetical protein